MNDKNIGKRVRIRGSSEFYDQAPDIEGSIIERDLDEEGWYVVLFDNDYSNSYPMKYLIFIRPKLVKIDNWRREFEF